MKKQTLRWLSRIMAVIMLLVTLPLPELKVFAADEHYGIWIGNEEFTSDHREIQGKQGKATVGEFGYGKDRTVTFSGNFVPKDGSDGVYTAANGRKYLVYIAEDTNYSSTFVEFDGKASFSSTDPQVMGLGSEAEMELVIAQGAEIEFKTENTALNIPEGDIYVETDGKLTVDVELQNGDSEISAVYASTLENLGTVDVKLKNKSGNTGSCTGIRCRTYLWNHGQLNFVQDPEDGPVKSGIYVEDRDPSFEYSIILSGDTNVWVYGDDSVAIGANEDTPHGNVQIGGKVFARGGMYAFMVKALYWDEYMKDLLYIKNPEDGVFSADGRTIFDSEGNVADYVEIAETEHYEIWVGEHEVTAGNRKNIPGILGEGAKASYDPDTSTLKFEGDVTGVEGLHDGAIIESSKDLNIVGNAVLQNDQAEVGIRVADNYNSPLTIDGEIEIHAKKTGFYAPYKNLEIKDNGKLKVVIKESGENGVKCKDLTVKRNAVLEVVAESGTTAGSLNVNGNMTIEGGTVSVAGATLLVDVSVLGDLSMDQGTLEVTSTVSGFLIDGFAVGVSGRLNMKDSVAKIKNEMESLGSGLNVKQDIFAENSILRAEAALTGISAVGGLYVTNTEVYAHGTDKNGIKCEYLQVNSGKVTADGGTQAIDSANGFDLKDGVDIVEPAGGQIVNKVIVGADGNTPATHVLIDGGTYYNLWVDAKQISDKNAANITFPRGGSASYDPETKTLTFNDDGAVLINTYFFDSALNNASIYAEQDLTIKGKVTIEGELSPKFGIYVDGNHTLKLEDAEVVCNHAHTEAAVDVRSGLLKLNNSSLDTKAAICAGGLVVDEGYIRAEDQGQVKNSVLGVYGDLVLYAGSIDVKAVTEDVPGINVSGDFLMEEDGTVSVEKNGKGSFAFSAQGELGMEGGRISISGNGAGVYGLDQTPVYMNYGADISIELTGADSVIADCNAKEIRIFDGRFTATANANGSKGIEAACFWLDGGTVSVESYDVALKSDKLKMKGGKLSAASTKENGQAVLIDSTGWEIGGDIMIVEPEGGSRNLIATTIVDKDGKIASKVVFAAEKKYDTEDAVWNLFTRTSASYEIAALSSSGVCENINKKSAKYYDAKLNGNIITVSLKSGVSRKKAAAAANSVLEFDLGEGGTVEYVLPVEYKKPKLKLAVTSVLIKDGADSAVGTQVLYKSSEGVFIPYGLYGATIFYGGTPVSGDNYGYIQFNTSSASKGAKLSITRDGWESPVELKFNVKTTTKDVLSTDPDPMSSLSRKKTLILNKNISGQNFQSQLYLNGQAVTGDKLEVTKGAEVAGITSEGQLFIMAQTDTKPGNYTVEIKQKDGKAKLKYKVKVSDKALDQTVSLKVLQKYNVVTGQPMVVKPVFKDAEMYFLGASVECSKTVAYAEADLEGNIYIGFEDSSLNAKDLNIGDMKITLKNGSTQIVVNLKNVKAKKTTPKVRAAMVNIGPDAKGELKGSVNILSTYKDAAGNLRVLIPDQVALGTAKGGEFIVNDYDRTEIDVKSLSGKSGNVKVTLTFRGGVTKKLSVKAKAAKKK